MSYIHISKEDLQKKIDLARTLVEKRYQAEQELIDLKAYQLYVTDFMRTRSSLLRVVSYGILALFGIVGPVLLTKEEFLAAAAWESPVRHKNLPCALYPVYYFDDGDYFCSQCRRDNDNNNLTSLEILIKTKDGKDPVLLSLNDANVLDRNLSFQEQSCPST